MELTFDRGTVLLDGGPEPDLSVALPHVLWDPRVARWRAAAYRYGAVRRGLASAGLPVTDHVGPRAGARVDALTPPLRDYQQDALRAWEIAGRRGVVVLPTGAGKTHVALAALARMRRSTLVLVPTRALLAQWYAKLREVVVGPVGRVGDGEHDVRPVTVCTFESALRHTDRFGDRFALLIVDEVHHFATGARAEALEMCPAEARLGLTATPPEDGAQLARLEDLVGPVVVERRVAEFVGRDLAPLRHLVIHVSLTRRERERYAALQEPFATAVRAFFRAEPNGAYTDFVRAASTSARGRALLEGHREAQALVAGCEAKLRAAARLLTQHRQDRVLLFTGDNRTAYRLSEELLVPAVTCDIGARERSAVLASFAAGALRGVVSSQVLNEGIDVPEAGVAVLLGGRLGKREHVQRIGRVLRPCPGKVATVYELVVEATFEARQHAQRSLALGRAA